ncbi:MAG: CarD family transcriptional regulator, partial [Rhodoblastus sp.]
MSNDLQRALKELERGGQVLLSRTPDGFDAFVAADLARALAAKAEGRSVALVHVARDGQRSRAFQDAFAFAAPDIEVLDFPSWDCQPYDRVSPNAGIAARRMTALSRLARSSGSEERPRILCTTVNALVQRVAPLTTIAADTFSAAPGNVVKTDDLVRWLEINGFLRSSTVRETGEYAMRGGIVDLFAPGMPAPIRLDFFGDTLETIRPFDPETQRSTGQLRSLDLVPMSEVQLTTDTMRRFRQAYLASFGAETRGDTLYEAISEGRRHPGMEHWLPLFHEQMDTLFDYFAGAPILLDPLAEDAAAERLAQARDYYDSRKEAYDSDPAGASYKPLKPDALYLKPDEFRARLDAAALARISPFATPDSPHGLTVDLGAGVGRSFAPERADENANVFEAAVKHIETLRADGRRVILAGWSDGSRERLGHVLAEHGLKKIEPVSSLAQTIGLKGVALAVIGLEQGFVAGDLAVIGEQDILGDRLVRARKRHKRENVLQEVGALSAGDLVVHVDHGIGRFIGLTQIQAIGVPHDCLELHYAGGDKLYLPVENLELLSRYGSEDQEATLDRLGGVGWQTRKARMKKRIREIAHG